MKKFTSILIFTPLFLFGIVLSFTSAAQTTLFESGFEAADPAFTYSSTTGTAATIAANARTGTNRGGLTANGTFDASFITPAINFVAGRYYQIDVYARAFDCTSKLQIYKNSTATNAAMKASTGGDIILSSASNNVTSTTYTLISVTIAATATETKFVGFQVQGTGGGACAAINIGVDDISITEYVDPPCGVYCKVGGTSSTTGHISNVTFAGIDRASAFDGYVCTGTQGVVRQTLSYDLVVSRNTSSYATYSAGWIDFNRDGDFADAGENVMASALHASGGTRTISVTVPAAATIGLTKMRIMSKYNADITGPCDNGTYHDVEDYDIQILAAPVNMVYSSMAFTQLTDTVLAGSFRNGIIGVNIITTGQLNAPQATSFTFRPTGTTQVADISATASVKLFYTGSSNTFATTTQVFGSLNRPATLTSDMIFTAGTGVELVEGDNWFWLAYDINATAPTGNRVDAELTTVTVAGTARTPSPAGSGNPTGSRPIKASTTMTYVSATVVQNENPVARGTVNQHIVSLEVVTSGAITPLSLTNIRVRTNGTSNVADAENLRIWFTADDPNFSTTTQFGATTAALPATGTNLNVAGSVTLVQGTNYFWITYDVKGTAGCNPNQLDAEVPSITVGGVARTPGPAGLSPGAPSGARVINCGTAYYSKGNLPPNVLSSWSATRDGTGAAPTGFTGAVGFYVQNGHTMSTTGTATITNMYIETGGYVKAAHLISMDTLLIFSGATYEQTVAASDATYLKNFTIKRTGVWKHNNNGKLPGVNRYFDPYSVQWFLGIGGGTFPAGTAWGSVILDIANTGNLIINANSISQIRGDFEMRRWGDGTKYMIINYDNPMTITGNMIVSGGWIAGVGGYNCNAGGCNCNGSGSVTVQVDGDFTMTGGRMEDFLCGDAGSTGLNLTIGGNVTISGGTLNLSKEPDSKTDLVTTVTSTTWSQTGGTSTLGNVNIKAGKTVTMTGTKLGDIAASRIMTVEGTARLNTSNYPVTGGGTFTLADNATIALGSAAGLNSAGASGNVQTTTRNFSSGANYIYYEGLTQNSGIFSTVAAGTFLANTIRNLTINKDAASQSVSLQQGMSVNQVTTLTRGELNLNSFTLTALSPSTGAITGGAAGVAYIKSETNAATNPSIIQWNIGSSTGSYIFPFGKNSASDGYIPVTFQVTTGAAGGNVQISTRATGSTNNTPWASGVSHMNRQGFDSTITSVIDRWWQITAAGYTANVTFSYSAATENTLPNGVTPAGYPNYRTGSLAVQRWNSTGGTAGTGDWDLPVGAGTGVASGVGTVSVTGVTAFSPWIVVAAPAPLPIQLVSFDAIKNGSKVNLSWASLSELRASRYVVERSKDGESWSEIAEVDAKGSSKTKSNYFASDSRPQFGINYYRLKLIDAEGGTSYHDQWRAVKFEGSGAVALYPNPSSDKVTIELADEASSALNVVFYDVTGKIVLQKTYLSGSGMTQLDISSLAKGMYYVSVSDGISTLLMEKFMKK